MSPARPYIESHSALRGIAAVVVLLDHLRAYSLLPTNGWLGRVFQVIAWNDLAVFLFFILSGYVMSYVYPSPVRWRHFFVARLARLVPVYEATLLVVLLLIYLHTYRENASPLNLGANLLMIQQWLPVAGWSSINFPSWSLSVEAFLYVAAFPLLIASRRRRWSRGLYVLLLVLGATWGVIYYNDFRPTLFRDWCFPLLSGLFGFGVGFSLQSLLGQERLRHASGVAALGGALVAASLLQRVIFPQGASHGWLALGLVLIVATSADSGSLAYRVLAQPVLLFLGDISYSLYLWHFPVLIILEHASNHLALSLHSAVVERVAPLVTTFLCMVLPFAVATASYYWLEVPFRRLIRDRFVRPVPGAVAASI